MLLIIDWLQVVLLCSCLNVLILNAGAVSSSRTRFQWQHSQYMKKAVHSQINAHIPTKKLNTLSRFSTTLKLQHSLYSNYGKNVFIHIKPFCKASSGFEAGHCYAQNGVSIECCSLQNISVTQRSDDRIRQR